MLKKTLEAILWLIIFAVIITGIAVSLKESDTSKQPQNYKSDEAIQSANTSTEMQQKIQQALAGDAEAQYILGSIYRIGQRVQRDNKEAVKWWTEAAEQEHAKAQHNLAHMYADGDGVQMDFKEAVKWWTKAAEQGLINAQFQLAWVYLEGKGVTQDSNKAVMWFIKAAEQGSVDAQAKLGLKPA